MARLNTRIQAEGAEFLVLGELLIRGILTYKTYTNMPGYDLFATNPSNGATTKISVKSRWMTKAGGFIIKNFNCDFVVVVKLNRGSKDSQIKSSLPHFYVLPVDVVHGIRATQGWGRINFNKIPEFDSYQDRWDLIEASLSKRQSKRTTARPAPVKRKSARVKKAR